MNPWPPHCERVLVSSTDIKPDLDLNLVLSGAFSICGGGLPGAVREQDAFGQLITDIDSDHARFFGHNHVEIFSPPHLFVANGNPAAWPVITSTPPESVT